MELFSGVSAQGELSEALANAIANAKSGLATDYVEWRLHELSGKDGGFLLAQELTLVMEVTKTSP